MAPAWCARLPSMRGPTARAASAAEIVPWPPAVVGLQRLWGGGVGGGASLSRLPVPDEAIALLGREGVKRGVARAPRSMRRGGSPPPGAIGRGHRAGAMGWGNMVGQ